MAEKYVCGYCGAEFDTPVERARCEVWCNEKQKEIEEKNRQEKLNTEKNNKLEEIRKQWATLSSLCKGYYDDYGEYISLGDKMPPRFNQNLLRDLFWF